MSGSETGGDTGLDGRPAWYHDLGFIQGVNVPGLGTQTPAEAFLHVDFASNAAAMPWNTWRATTTWQYATDASGELDPTLLAEQHAALEAMLETLQASRSDDERVLVIVNFHQFKFGPACGGSGIPAGAIDETGLDDADPNCTFQAFERFWTTPAAQEGWLDYVMAFTEPLIPIAAEHEDWLTLGLDLMNEPFAGGERPLDDLGSLDAYLSVEQVSQIESRLVPFHSDFLAALEELYGAEDFVDRTLLVFEPFALDHFEVPGLTPIDGDYSAMREHHELPQSGHPVTWLAAPHHYDGGYNPDVLQFGTTAIEVLLTEYPNLFFSKEQIVGRMELQESRFAEAGMEFILGEWGTYTTLRDANGEPGGYRDWIDDSLGGVGQHTRGHLWWAYVRDTTESEVSFNLLRSRDDVGESLPADRQVLKCTPELDVTELVFGTCP